MGCSTGAEGEVASIRRGPAKVKEVCKRDESAPRGKVRPPENDFTKRRLRPTVASAAREAGVGT